MLASSETDETETGIDSTEEAPARSRGLGLVVLVAVAVIGLAGLGWLAFRTDPVPAPGVGGSQPIDRGADGRVGNGSETIVFIGDSLTSLGQWEGLLPTYDVVNRGFPGVTTDQLLFTAQDVAADGPGLVFLLSGTNDIASGRSADWTASHLEEILDVFAEESPTTMVVVQTIPPRADLADVVPFTNSEIRRVAGERGLPLIDLYPLFDNGFGGLRLGETTDGIHLSPIGYLLWSAQLRLFLDAQGW